jgi:hypothetical protein
MAGEHRYEFALPVSRKNARAMLRKKHCAHDDIPVQTTSTVIRNSLFLGLIVATFATARAGILSELSIADQKTVKSGGQVMVSESLEGYPWPRVRVYQAVKATPREVMAVFTDYNSGCNFVPNCLKSQIAKQITPLVAHVDYVIDVPILADESYTVSDTLSEEPGGALRVAWKMIKATSILESQGNLFAEPHGENGSLIRYTNLVKPSSAAAPLLRGMAMSQMKDTVDAIVARVEEIKNKPSMLQPELDRLDAALGKKN